MSLRWTVAQIGHREEYAAARAMAAEGRLDRLCTDLWCRFGASALRRGPAAGRKLALRHHPALGAETVVAWSGAAAARMGKRALTPGRWRTPDWEEFVRYGRWFDAKVAGHLRRQDLPPERSAFFSFNIGCLETLRQLRDRGVTALVDQVNPGRVEYELMLREEERWPGWQQQPTRIPDAYFERRLAECDAAAGVIVNSSWSADALVSQGVPAERLTIVPLAYEPPADVLEGPTPERGRGGPLKVLWLGPVMLRKGIQYLVEAARLLEDRSIRFTVVGPVQISDAAVGSAPPSMAFKGPVTHDRVSREYNAADVFVLPTVSDNFARTELEAMAHALPVVTTRNCGTAVEDGQNGLVVPAADAASLAAALAKLDDDRDLVAAMAERARHKAAQFSLSRYREGLDAAAAHFMASG